MSVFTTMRRASIRLHREGTAWKHTRLARRTANLKRSQIAIRVGINALVTASLVAGPAALAASRTARTPGSLLYGQVLGNSGQPVSGASLTLVAWPPHPI